MKRFVKIEDQMPFLFGKYGCYIGPVFGECEGMGFTDVEIARYAGLIEKLIWSKRRPPLHLRDKVREGQRIAGYEIELFLVRPLWCDPAQQVDSSIAKTRYVKSRNVWQVFWKRADMKWHRYPPRPEVKSFAAFLKLVDEDAHGCFWG